MKNESKQTIRRLAILDKEFDFGMLVHYKLRAGYSFRISSTNLPIVRVEDDGRLFINLGRGISGHVPVGDFHLEEEVETHTVTITRRRINIDENK